MSNTSKTSSQAISDEPSKESINEGDWSRAPFADQVYEQEHLARIDEDLVEHFPTVDDVNDALRSMLVLSRTLKRQQKRQSKEKASQG